MHFATFYGIEDESRQPLVELVEVLSGEKGRGGDQDQGRRVEEEGWSVSSRKIDLREAWKEKGGLGLLILGKLGIAVALVYPGQDYIPTSLLKSVCTNRDAGRPKDYNKTGMRYKRIHSANNRCW